MKNTAVASDEIDEILIQWYEWSQSYQPALGYGRADSTCRDFKISNQWMDYQDLSEQVDHHLLGMTGEAVEPIILKLNTNHRIAVMTAMRNFAAGSHVFANPRSPATQDADYADAKAVMKPKFVSKGLLKTS